MVHLVSVPTEKDVQAITKQLPNIRFEDAQEEDSPYASVYGSRFAGQDLPKVEMPEKEMPKEIAYRMIKDDLTLDGTPTLNLASFVTTYMEEEAEKLMVEGFSKNFIDYEEYPVSCGVATYIIR